MRANSFRSSSKSKFQKCLRAISESSPVYIFLGIVALVFGYIFLSCVYTVGRRFERMNCPKENKPRELNVIIRIFLTILYCIFYLIRCIIRFILAIILIPWQIFKYVLCCLKTLSIKHFSLTINFPEFPKLPFKNPFAECMHFVIKLYCLGRRIFRWLCWPFLKIRHGLKFIFGSLLRYFVDLFTICGPIDKFENNVEYEDIVEQKVVYVTKQDQIEQGTINLLREKLSSMKQTYSTITTTLSNTNELLKQVEAEVQSITQIATPEQLQKLLNEIENIEIINDKDAEESIKQIIKDANIIWKSHKVDLFYQPARYQTGLSQYKGLFTRPIIIQNGQASSFKFAFDHPAFVQKIDFSNLDKNSNYMQSFDIDFISREKVISTKSYTIDTNNLVINLETPILCDKIVVHAKQFVSSAETATIPLFKLYETPIGN